jgi:2,4-dienoyl-CoA reductase-like NADH-dependent reductase (Old Yellow Enzyme family)
MPIGIRLSVTDWVDGGFNPDEAVAVARALEAEGLAFVCASSGGVAHDAKVAEVPSYQVPFAEKVRREARIVTRAVGLIDDPLVAEKIVADGKADLVALGRGFLADPRWAWRAAVILGEPLHPVSQYHRAAPLLTKWASAQAKAKENA